jgi:hypothetical protein
LKPSTKGKPSIPPPRKWSRMANSASFRLLLTRLLTLTNGESVEIEALRGSLRITKETFDALLEQLSDDGLVSLQGQSITLKLEQRLSVAMKAVEAGADTETISRNLGWFEFEELSARVFEANCFRVMRRFRFTAEGRRWELDLLAIRAPYLVCGECKHWGKGIGNQTARGIIEIHLEKTEVFMRHIEGLRERIGICGWSKAVIVPMALTLSATPMEICRRVPSVSVLALPSFINEFDGQLERIANWKTELQPMKPEIKYKRPRKRVSDSKQARRL